jgi:predicted methyltransferase
MRLTIPAAMAALMIALPAFAGAKPPPYMTAAVSDAARPADDTARDANRKPVDMLMFAGVKPGAVVVDVMPGKGYFTRIFAKAVGPSGHVYAYWPSEIDPLLKGKPPSVVPVTNDHADYPNASLIHGSLDKFVTPQPVDVVWTSQNYHDFHNKDFGPVDIAAMNKGIYDSLKPGGVYIVLDHAAEAGSGTRDTDTLHRIDPEVVKKEVTAAGFKFVGEDKMLANPADDHKLKVFDPSIRGKTDQFIYKFRKPLH